MRVMPLHVNQKSDYDMITVNIFLPISFHLCFGCSIETSHRDGSFEYHNICFGLEKKINMGLITSTLYLLVLITFSNSLGPDQARQNVVEC